MKCRKLDRAQFQLKQKFREISTVMKLLILHFPVINWPKQFFSLLFRKHNVYYQRNLLELFVKLNRTTLYLFIIMIQLGLLPFQMICIFQSLSRHHLKACKYFMWTMTKNKFWFSLSNLSFLNKIRSVKRTRYLPWKRIDKWQKWLMTKS